LDLPEKALSVLRLGLLPKGYEGDQARQKE